VLRVKSRVGPKGQAVIPKPVRDELGIRPGDEVYFSTHEGHAHLEKRPPSEMLREFFNSLPDRPTTRRLTAREIKDLREEQYEKEFVERDD
jgi:AbrB family looped-hinge helix DNA binding protein